MGDPETSDSTISTVFKHYKNLVNREGKTCRAMHYESRIQHQRTLLYLQWRAKQIKYFVGEILLVELVTIIVSYFSNYIVIVVRNVIKVSL